MHTYCQNHNKKTKNRIFLNALQGIFATLSFKDIVIKPIMSIEEKFDPQTQKNVTHTESVRIKLEPAEILFAHKCDFKTTHKLTSEYLGYQVHLKSGQVYYCLKIYGAQRKHIYPENLQQIIQDYQEVNRFAKYRNWAVIALMITPVLEWWKSQPLLTNALNQIWKLIF